MTRDQHFQALRTSLVAVCMFETLKNYTKRNKAILAALHHAAEIGYPCGIRFDPVEPEWPVVFLELDDGQLTWHIPQHAKEWDGHDTEEKYRRLSKWIDEYV